MKMVIVLWLILLTGCTEQVTVVAIEDSAMCQGGETKVTVMDSRLMGRFKRCGVWGNVGDTFNFTR